MISYNSDRAEKRPFKNNIFRDLFTKKQYLLELYKTLHPEDDGAKEEDIDLVDFHTVLVNGMYNDIGFVVGDKLILLVRTRTIWTDNVLVRCYFKLAELYKDIIAEADMNINCITKLELPKPELYIIYTGEQEESPTSFSLGHTFFGDDKSCLELNAKVIYYSDKNTIIDQYIHFCRIATEKIGEYGRTFLAASETIKECKERNILKTYIKGHENEITEIMLTLFDDDVIMANYYKEIADRAHKKGEIDFAKKLVAAGTLTIEDLMKSGICTPNQIAEISM